MTYFITRGIVAFSILCSLSFISTPTIAQALPLAAANQPDHSPLLRWRDIVELVKKHPLIGEAQYRVRAAQGKVLAAGQVPNPIFGAHLGQGWSGPEADKHLEWGLSLTLPLEWLALRGSHLEAAKAGTAAAEYEAQRIRLEVLHQLKAFFWNMAYDQQLVASYLDSEARAEEFTRLVGRRVEKGEARPIEATRMEIELEKVRIERERAQAQLYAHKEQLRLWLGGKAAPDFHLEAELSSEPKLPVLASLLAKVQQHHPAILSAKARIQVQGAEVRSEQRKRLPSINLAGSYEVEVDKTAYAGTINLDLPLWNWNTGRLNQATARQLAEEQRLAAITQDMISATIEAYHLCSHGVQTIHRFQEKILPGARKALTNIERTFQLGETNLLEVLDARRVSLDAQQGYIGAQLQHQLHCTALQALTGDIVHE